MNIIKIILVFIFLFFNFLSINSISYSEDTNETENPTETINLDEEELPAIDPFGSSSSAGMSSSAQPSNSSEDEGILRGLKLIGVIIGENNKIAVLVSKDGYASNFKENDAINENVELQEIYTDHLLIKNTLKDDAGLTQEKFYEVYMNDIIRTIDG